MSTKRDTYKYQYKVGNKVVHGGITNNLERRESEHKNSRKKTRSNNKAYDWSKGHIVKVGIATTREAALKWERDNCHGANQSC